MKKILISALCIPLLAQAQTIKVRYYQSMYQENAQYRVAIDDAVSKENFVKFKIIVTNKTDKTILFRPSLLKVYLDDSLKVPKEDMLAIAPYMSATRVVDIKGSKMMGSKLRVVTDGVFSEVSEKKDSVAKFTLGSAALTSNSIVLVEERVKRNAKKSYVQFKVQYTGEAVLRVVPGKIRILAPNGAVFVPEVTKPAMIHLDKTSKPDRMSIYIVIPPGAGDMVKQDIVLLWNDAFSTVNSTSLPSITINCSTDENKTIEKNK